MEKILHGCARRSDSLVHPRLQDVLGSLGILDYPKGQINQDISFPVVPRKKKICSINGTLIPGIPTAPRSPLFPVHLHGTPQHSRSAMLS